MGLIVTYELNGISKVTEFDDICEVYDGFWIDDSGQICFMQDAQFFIMPHMIKEIRKEHEDGYSDNQN